MNLYFTYRWLLLECKREFPFNDALHVLEVMWATLPIDSEPPELSEISLITSPSDTIIIDAAYPISCQQEQRHALSCPHLPVIEESNIYESRHRSSSLTCHSKEPDVQSQLQDDYNSTSDGDDHEVSSSNNTNTDLKSISTRSKRRNLENSFSLSEISEFDSDSLSTSSNYSAVNNFTTNAVASQYPSTSNWLQRLSTDAPLCFEDDNLFLLFICVSLLLAHRSFLLKQTNLDEQEISMHFDRYRRRHNAERILLYARALYAQYIQWARKKRMLDDLNRFSAS